jgi:hypothetical protein
MGGPGFRWDTPFYDERWQAELRLHNGDGGPLSIARFKLGVHGLFTTEHHFGIQLWEDEPKIAIERPIDVLSVMASVATRIQARMWIGEQEK